MSGESPRAKRPTRKRGARGNLRKSQEIDHVVVEDLFQLNLPDSVDAPTEVDRKAGEGCYVSAIVHNRRYYGVLIDQASLQSASQLYFEDEASGLDLNRRMEYLIGQQQEQDVVGDPANRVVEDDRKRAAETDISHNGNKRARHDCQPDVSGSNTNAALVRKRGAGIQRQVQKFRYVDPDKSGIKDVPGYRILLATYADVNAAAEDDPERSQMIESACESGGDFVGNRFYQYEVKNSTLQLATTAKAKERNDNSLRMSMGFQTFLHNTILPNWFPLANLHGGQQKLLTMLNMKKDNNGNVIWDNKPYVDAALAPREDLIPMEPRSRFRVCVVGGGMAGLSCCLELFRITERDGIDVEVVLLEARPRLGGRLWTDRETFKSQDGESFPVDLGASWIHGITMNPLAALAREAGLDFVTTSEDVKMFQCDMEEVDAGKDERAGKLFDELLDIAANDCWISADGASSRRSSQATVRWYASALHDSNKDSSFVPPSPSRPPPHRRSDDVSVDHAVGKAIMKHKHAQFASLSDEERRMLTWNLKNVEYALGANIKDLSMKFWDIDERHAFEGDHVLLRQGYSTVVHYLHNQLKQRGDRFKYSLDFPVGKLEYNKKTSTQSYSSTQARNQNFVELSDTCSITSKDETRSIKSDFVVSAVPLGVLKASVKEDSQAQGIAFTPPLPFVKRDAIDNVGFGLLNKVYLQFPFAFWAASPILGPEQTQFGNASGVNPHHYMFLDIGKTLGAGKKAPAILMSLISGREAATCEKYTEKALVGEVMDTLRALFSTIHIPEPVAVKVTRWGSDPFSRGSYTFLTPGTTDQDFETLQSPVNGNGDSVVLEGGETMRLFFAGEHTTALHPSMAHGAMLSGMRAAKEVIDSMSVNLGTDDEFDRLIPLSLFRYMNPKRGLLCCMCHKEGTTFREGKLLAFRKGSRQILCHTNCAENSPEVEVFEGKWKDVLTAVNRSRTLSCFACNQVGATVGCAECDRCYHFSCGEDTGWRFDVDGKEFYCDLHRSLLVEDCRRISMNFFRSKSHSLDRLKCELCGTAGSSKELELGEPLAFIRLSKIESQQRMAVVHENCIRYTSIIDISETSMSKFDKEFSNVFSAIDQAKTCSFCSKTGATIRCLDQSCGQCYHYLCAKTLDWNFEKQGPFRCKTHRDVSMGFVGKDETPIASEIAVGRPSFQHALFAANGPKREQHAENGKGESALPRLLEPDILSVHSSSDDGDASEEIQNVLGHVDGHGTAKLPSADIGLAITSLNSKLDGVHDGVVRLVRLARPSVQDRWDVDIYATAIEGTPLRTLTVASAKPDPFDQLEDGDVVRAINGVRVGSPLLGTLQKVFSFLSREIEIIVEVRRPKTPSRSQWL